MSRTVVDLFVDGTVTPVPEPVPYWWKNLFYERQTEIRARIPRALRAACRQVTARELAAYVVCYDDREIEHALATLERAGSIDSRLRISPDGTERRYYATAKGEEG